MITISLCMIVKNEEKLLARCLDTLRHLVDEIILVDTGSTDRTKQIAAQYTDKVYDFEWIGDFSAARNFAFSKAAMEYIYSADADEVMDKINQERFLQMKSTLLPEIEIVQMKYANQLEFGTTYNYNTEYRPKLFKRLRTFRWVERVHEMVRIDPVVYDSGIEIIHRPEQNHAGRDFDIFLQLIGDGERLNRRLLEMYAKELFISGTDQDMIDAYPSFLKMTEDINRSHEELQIIFSVLAAASRRKGEMEEFFTSCIKAVADAPGSELCYELGEYYLSKDNYTEAMIWYYNAAMESESLLNIHYSGDYPLRRLAECCRATGANEQAASYTQQALDWLTEFNQNYR